METHTPYHTEQSPVEMDRAMWDGIRQGFLQILESIEVRWGFDRSQGQKARWMAGVDRTMWAGIRQGGLQALAAIEQRWGFDRSREPKRKK